MIARIVSNPISPPTSSGDHDYEVFEKKDDGSGWKDGPDLNLVCSEESLSYQGEVNHFQFIEQLLRALN